MIRRGAVALALLALTGGATTATAEHWWDFAPGATEQDFLRDLYECRRDAAMLVPSSPPPLSSGGGVSDSMDAFYAGSHAADIAAQRRAWTRDCLRSKGHRGPSWLGLAYSVDNRRAPSETQT